MFLASVKICADFVLLVLFVCLFVFGFFDQNISCEHYFSCLLLQA